MATYREICYLNLGSGLLTVPSSFRGGSRPNLLSFGSMEYVSSDLAIGDLANESSECSRLREN